MIWYSRLYFTGLPFLCFYQVQNSKYIPFFISFFSLSDYRFQIDYFKDFKIAASNDLNEGGVQNWWPLRQSDVLGVKHIFEYILSCEYKPIAPVILTRIPP